MSKVIDSTIIIGIASSIQRQEDLKNELIKFKLELELQIKKTDAQLELFNSSIKAKFELDGGATSYVTKKRTNIINQLRTFNIGLEDTTEQIDTINSMIQTLTINLYNYLRSYLNSQSN